MKSKEEILVISDLGLFDENIYYCGSSEVEAFKKFKSIRGRFKNLNIVKADIEKRMMKDIPIIWDYSIIEILR